MHYATLGQFIDYISLDPTAFLSVTVLDYVFRLLLLSFAAFTTWPRFRLSGHYYHPYLHMNNAGKFIQILLDESKTYIGD